MKFETRICSRCGGTGEFSFNCRDGKRCFNCDGSGKVYTKRGAKAFKFFQDSLIKKIEDVAVGEFVRDGNVWKQLKNVENDGEIIHVRFVKGRGFKFLKGSVETVCSVKNQTDLDSKKAAAIEYQNTLK